MNSDTKIGATLIAALVFLATACGEYEPDHDLHYCNTYADSAFTILDLTLDHSDSRACEMNHGPGDTISSAAKVYEFNANYPTAGYSIHLYMTVYDWYDFASNPWQGVGTILGGAEQQQSFFWGPHPDPFENEQIWQAGGSATYVAGESADFVENIVWIGCCPLPWDYAYGVLEVVHSGGGGGGPGSPTED